MSDEWADRLFVASYGGFEIDVLDTDDDLSRSLIVSTYPRRSGGHVDDDGQEPRSTSCTIIFAAGLREEPHVDRMLSFLNLLADGRPHTLVHPVTGSYEARPGQIRFAGRGSQRDVLMVSVVFHEHIPDPAAFEVDLGAPVRVGAQEVSLTAAELDAELSSAGLSSDVGAEALGSAEAWEGGAGTLTAREINLELNRVANEIEAEVARLELETDVDRQPLWQSMLRLRAALRRAAEAAVRAAPRIVRYTVPVRAPLLVVVSNLYGPEDAEANAERLMEMNDIRDPAQIEAGSVLSVRDPSDPPALRVTS